MTTYLYVKTHNKTGLKYLGKTTSKDPHKYKGSGTYWLLHLKKHGFDYTTTILKECENLETVKFWGSYYSNLWNIVESDDWANLKPETGEGGGVKGQPKSGFTKIRMSDAQKRRGNKYSSKVVSSRKENGKPWHSVETRNKISEANKRRSPPSNETRQKQSLALKGKPKPLETVEKMKAAWKLRKS